MVEEGEFYWTADCALPDYSNWNETNHPKNDDKECVTMDGAGSWHDNDCAFGVAGYICEQTERCMPTFILIEQIYFKLSTVKVLIFTVH